MAAQRVGGLSILRFRLQHGEFQLMSVATKVRLAYPLTSNRNFCSRCRPGRCVAATYPETIGDLERSTRWQRRHYKGVGRLT
jgi:hypothetical protein